MRAIKWPGRRTQSRSRPAAAVRVALAAVLNDIDDDGALRPASTL